MKIKTLADARLAGYRDGEIMWQRGYVTRKNRDDSEIPVKVAGGHRKGQLYYDAPCFKSTYYCYRVYLKEA